MPDRGEREALVAADYNAEMIEHIARYPRVRDQAVFVGSPDDIVPDTFGPQLPLIGDWTREHYRFAGYVMLVINWSRRCQRLAVGGLACPCDAT